MKIYGLIGRNIGYSFSRTYFFEKFQNGNIKAEYKNFDLEEISEFPEVIKNITHLSGLNVTIPYKQEIIPFLDALDQDAKNIGAVNTIKIEDKKLIGFNTDFIGFLASIKPKLKSQHKKALILGTGGASKAIAYALDKLDIAYVFVSRAPGKGKFTYGQITENILQEYTILINCSPLGTFPEVERYPDIPFHYLNENHLVYDLIYNPGTTKFMELAKKQGATTTNGLEMLKLQAEKAWEIWNS